MASSHTTNEDQPPVVVATGHDTRGGGGGEEEEESSSLYTTPRGYTCGGAIQKLGGILSLMASPLTDETGSTRSVVAGLATIVVVGTCVGWVAPENPILSPSYRRISAALGYIYFMAWSVSFYPQVISNFKRKSTVGLSPDFVLLNVIGFGCYTAYTAAFFWSPSIRNLYKDRYGPDAEITVQSNDVAFAIHALILSFVTLCQMVYYNHSHCLRRVDTLAATGNRATLRLSKPIVLVIIAIAIISIGYPLILMLDRKRFDAGDNEDSESRFNWLGFLYVLSYIKIFISLIKYIPQVLMNFQRKSTEGWSIWNILLDFTGGTLSDLQLVLDCADLKDFSGITHNEVKLALGSLSIVFDLIFLAQHYCLYSGRTTVIATNEQSEPLLSPQVLTATGGSMDEGNENEIPTPDSSSSEPRTIFV